jgi:hypothetical protein
MGRGEGHGEGAGEGAGEDTGTNVAIGSGVAVGLAVCMCLCGVPMIIAGCVLITFFRWVNIVSSSTQSAVVRFQINPHVVDCWHRAHRGRMSRPRRWCHLHHPHLLRSV